MFDSLFNNNEKHNILGLTDELKCIYVYNMFIKNKKSKLIITNTLYEANKIYNIMNNYTDKCYLFPMDDFLTSEALAVSPELKATRLETMEKIINDDIIVITNLMGYLRFLPSKKTFID